MHCSRWPASGQVQGWVAGAGFDGRSELLEQGAACLPLLGTAADDVRRVRDPVSFFGFLRSNGIGHPPVRHDASVDTAGWLVKDAGASGGWHIRRAADAGAGGGEVSPLRYWQREVSGTAMSATFIANGRDAVVLGHNEQIVRPIAGRPFVFCGVLRPGAGECSRRARSRCGRARAGSRIPLARAGQPGLHARRRARVGAGGQSTPAGQHGPVPRGRWRRRAARAPVRLPARRAARARRRPPSASAEPRSCTRPMRCGSTRRAPPRWHRGLARVTCRMPAPTSPPAIRFAA